MVMIMTGMLMIQPVVNFVVEDTAIIVEAHSGRTDSSGGHKDNKNKSGLGSYHYADVVEIHHICIMEEYVHIHQGIVHLV